MRSDKASPIGWSGESFEDHRRQLLERMNTMKGYESEEQTQVFTVFVASHENETDSFVAEPGKYWSLLFVEYCMMIGIKGMKELQEEAEKFFIGIWKTDHGGFVSALEKAVSVNTHHHFEKQEEDQS